MNDLQKLIDHLKSLPPGDESVSNDFQKGFDACVWAVECYRNNQRVNGKLRANNESQRSAD